MRFIQRDPSHLAKDHPISSQSTPIKMESFWPLTCSLLIGLTLALAGCKPVTDFDNLGLKIAGPADTAMSADGKHFYVLNSDFEWKYDKGSILGLSEDGTKEFAIETRRMGRTIDVKGTRMVALFDIQRNENFGTVQVYDASDPVAPKLSHEWEIDCSPLASTFTATYDYFFVTCANGDLYIGSFTDASLFKKVRSYFAVRRALYLDASRDRLFAFVTDIGAQSTSDRSNDIDSQSYDSEGVATEAANEVPDNLENTRQARRRVTARYNYQFIVYDIAAEKALNFPYRFINDRLDDTALYESRWLYFELTNADGIPDDSLDVRSNNTRDYRTNFWMTQPDPHSDHSFYLSHRGLGTGSNILKVTIKGDLSIKDPSDDGTCAEHYRLERKKCIPFTESVMDFERVYGFAGEVNDHHYPGDFQIQNIAGHDVLLVNHFRDLLYWRPADRSFSVASKILDDSDSLQEIQSTDHHYSYYSITANTRGKAVSASFYGDAVMLLNIKPGESIHLEKYIGND